ncbi:MAG: hypothetical protein ACFFDS_10655 [Candidatus Thorarchaeota archaeon]
MRLSNTIGILIGSLIIIGGITGAIVYFVWEGGSNYVDYGTLSDNETYPSGVLNPNIYINCDATTASINVVSDTMPTGNIIEIDNLVRGPKKLEDDYPEKADYWTISNDEDGNYTLEFIKADPTRTIYRFSHEIEIRVDYRAKLILDMSSTTGALYIDTLKPDVEIEIVNLHVTTGDIGLDLAEDNVVTGDLLISATTGDIYLGFEEGIILDVDTFQITVTTGEVVFDFYELTFTSNLDIGIAVTTGDFSLFWEQISIMTNHTFDIVVTTGDVDLQLDLDTNIGTIFTTSIVTGSTDVPSDTISQGGMGQLTFDITVTTGSISANRT